MKTVLRWEECASRVRMKNSVAVVVLGVVLGAGILLAQSRGSGEKVMPALVANATWVQVRTMVGDQYGASTTPEDRRAIAEVEKRIRGWGRYKLAYKERDADIILVVRRGALASAKPGVIIGGGRDRPISPSIGVATEVGPSEDMIAVFDAHFGIDGAPLWRRLQKGGLLNELPLFKEFKREVEAAKKP
jgi:hypothetical protein